MPERAVVTAPAARSGGRRVLTAAEFDVLWDRLGLGPTPAVLRLPVTGSVRSERCALEAAGWEGLRRRGLAGPAGLDPELVRLLHLLAAPTAQLELRARIGREVRAAAAGRPGSGVLAVRQDATVALQPCGVLPAALLSTLPAATPGPGRPVTVATDLLTKAMTVARPGQLGDELLARDVAVDEARLLARMLEGAGARAQLGALASGPSGVMRRVSRVIGVLDGRDGRYVSSRGTGPDGTDRTTVAPADDRLLRHGLVELLAEAAAAAA
jgi:hypothetical protein